MQICDFPYEIVIGEDYSTDSTRDICEEYAQRYPQIVRLLSSDKNLGMNPNFTRTIEACKGKYVAVCEGDDYWTDANKLKKQVALLDNNENYSACISNAKMVTETSSFIRIYFNGLKEGIIPAETVINRGGAIYPTASIVFRNNKFTIETLYNTEELAGDNTLIISLVIKDAIYYIDEILCAYRIWGGGVYTRTVNDIEETILRKVNTVVGLKKILRNSAKPYKRYIKNRISKESLFILQNSGVIKKMKFILYLKMKDLIRLIMYRLQLGKIKVF
jgi:glycosyltransferase involved in cell wall biosynthesis